MARFIAIPVGQGDAFYFEDDDDFSVLVDGGLSRRKFPSLFKKHTDTDGVNIAICTHNDADHGKGILGFIEDKRLRCDELWLPGSWLGVLPDVLMPLEAVFDELIINVAQERKISNKDGFPSNHTPLEVFAEKLEYNMKLTRNDIDSSCEVKGNWLNLYASMLKKAEPWELTLPPSQSKIKYRWTLSPYYCNNLGKNKFKLLFSAIKAAELIREIALAAFKRGILIRWFEYNPYCPSSGKAGLQPVNSREVAIVSPRSVSLLHYLALTVVNKESLVFYYGPTKKHPGVLFTADSDLAEMNLPNNLKNAIVTAPHHGSEDNAQAYTRLQSSSQKYYSTINWVRSDRKSKRPGDTYRRIKSKRYCTICRLDKKKYSKNKREVYFCTQCTNCTHHYSTIVWSSINSTCNCK